MNTSIKRWIATDHGVGSLVLRWVAAVIFIAHGGQKLFGWFGGYGLEGTGQWMASVGLEPGYLMALLAGGVEFFGGVLLLVGLLTRLAGAALAVTMLVAVLAVHLSNGLFVSQGGFEFALSLLGISLALVFSGAGAFSLDRMMTQKFRAAE